MLLQDLLVATVLLEQMDNYAKQEKKNISVSSQKETYLYSTPVFFALKISCSGWLCLLCISEIPNSNLSSETSYLYWPRIFIIFLTSLKQTLWQYLETDHNWFFSNPFEFTVHLPSRHMSSVVQQPCSCQRIIHTRNKHTEIPQLDHFMVHDNHSATQASMYHYSCQLKLQRFKLQTVFFITWLKLDITAVQQLMPLPALWCSVQKLKKTPCSRCFEKPNAHTHKTILLQHKPCKASLHSHL